MQFRFASYSKMPTAPTGYQLSTGSSSFGQSVYLMDPLYVRARSNSIVFSLVVRGRYISGFFKTPFGGWFMGDHHRRGLLIYRRPDSFDLWEGDVPLSEIKLPFSEGRVTEQLHTAREKYQRHPV